MKAPTKADPHRYRSYLSEQLSDEQHRAVQGLKRALDRLDRVGLAAIGMDAGLEIVSAQHYADVTIPCASTARTGPMHALEEAGALLATVKSRGYRDSGGW